MNVRRALRRPARLALSVALILFVLASSAAVWLVLDARRTPAGNPEYVALGSSYAAGAGLGPRQPGSPRLCGRSINGYPPRVARELGLSLIDMTCGGSVTKHVRDGGQFFQDAQIRTLSRRTRLVTVTVGGNDVGFVRDLYLLAARNTDTTFGWLVGKLWGGPPPIRARSFDKLHGELVALLHTVRSRSPEAIVVVATYPTVLPPGGTCPQLRLSPAEVKLMRMVEDRLATVTRDAARIGGAKVVDMHALGADYHACSAGPWAKGWGRVSQSPFHPTVLGAQATADAIVAMARNGRPTARYYAFASQKWVRRRLARKLASKPFGTTAKGRFTLAGYRKRSFQLHGDERWATRRWIPHFRNAGRGTEGAFWVPSAR